MFLKVLDSDLKGVQRPQKRKPKLMHLVIVLSDRSIDVNSSKARHWVHLLFAVLEGGL